MASRLRIAAAALVLLPAGATAYGAWYGSDQAIKVVHHGARDVSVLAVRNGTVTLTDTPDTRKPGTYWLEWTGSYTMLGDIVSRAPGRVTRTRTGGSTPSVGTSGWFGSVPPGDPEVAWGVGFSEIMIPTELGPAPAWHVPGDSGTWVIAVHGQNGRRKAELKALPAVHRLGLPFLVISYRNDEGAPASPDGLLHLGDSEWRDLESAVRAAQGMGARQIVLYGTSMGGQIVGQFLDRSPLAGAVRSVIMDAPITDMVRAGRQGVANLHLPPPSAGSRTASSNGAPGSTSNGSACSATRRRCARPCSSSTPTPTRRCRPRPHATSPPWATGRSSTRSSPAAATPRRGTWTASAMTGSWTRS
ncbi:hypothetical protein [Nonomuraea sp. SBT364]|uniref:hypothetical protein n=1 Tax=Nonomuraea sp. SBT364 TaxID=1580530 RepID=UPI000AD50070|nr:hypothetical protein [Nonomuraea sp. SBT364]